MGDEHAKLRIAVACEDDRGLEGNVSGHFGRCPAFTVASVSGTHILGHEVITNPHYEEHVPGAVPAFLADLKANVVLAGGMGPRAVQMFASQGIQVATGFRSTVHEALADWIEGARGITPCQHDHPDSCGGHGD